MRPLLSWSNPITIMEKDGVQPEDLDNDAEKPRPATAHESGGEVDAKLEAPHDADDSLNHIASQRSIPILTLSKPRAIALVATVTGAAFLNVGLLTGLSPLTRCPRPGRVPGSRTSVNMTARLTRP